VEVTPGAISLRVGVPVEGLRLAEATRGSVETQCQAPERPTLPSPPLKRRTNLDAAAIKRLGPGFRGGDGRGVWWVRLKGGWYQWHQIGSRFRGEAMVCGAGRAAGRVLTPRKPAHVAPQRYSWCYLNAL
jgi:hypothetical protein